MKLKKIGIKKVSVGKFVIHLPSSKYTVRIGPVCKIYLFIYTIFKEVYTFS